MHLVDPARLREAATADPEFELAARYWTATLSLETSSGALRIDIVDGRVAVCQQSEAGGPAMITISGSEAGWAEFLAPVPRPFYQDLLGGCVQHHGFAVRGDALALSAYYQASQRLFALMRGLRAGREAGRGAL